MKFNISFLKFRATLGIRLVLVIAILLQSSCVGCRNAPPISQFTASTTNGKAPLAVSFDGSASTDNRMIETYAWDFGDGQQGTGMTVSHTYTEPGTHIATLTVTDNGNKSASSSQEIVVLPENLPPVAAFRWDTSEEAPLRIDFDASDSLDADGEIEDYQWDYGDGSTGNGIRSSHNYQQADTYTVRLTVRDNDDAAAAQIVVITTSTADTELPPDPSTVAPELDQTVATDLATATEFLYTGDNPIQTGVEPGTIEPERVAVLRGVVLDRDNNPLSGVTISIFGHPEFGQTLSREDGMFDLVVNGGGLLKIQYEKDDYLSVHRQLDTPWQSFMWAPDVVMIQQDPVVTTVDLTQTADDFIVVRGSVVTDEDGSRQQTLLIRQGTKVEMVLPDGQVQTLEEFHVRITEFTVGENGPEAMPAELPPNTGYTYAAEFAVDEAIEAGATEVKFDQPVFSYMENFVNMPVGSAVPVGFYDETKGQWIADSNGLIVEIVTIENGLAQIDMDGDGEADDRTQLNTIGLTESEQRTLAIVYTETPQSLWRVPLNHFSKRDHNFLRGLLCALFSISCDPEQNPNPKGDEPGSGLPDDGGGNGGCFTNYSIIECHNQVLGEQIPLVGTSFTLNYRSSRVIGRESAYTIDIPLTVGREELPEGLARIEVEVVVGGISYPETYLPELNLIHTFEWDGTTAYSKGERVQGVHPIFVRIDYVYPAVYYSTAAETQASFGNVEEPIEYIDGRDEFVISQEWESTIGTWNMQANGLGAWSLDVHHVFDTSGQVVFTGDGRQYSVAIASNTVTAYAGDQSHAERYGGIFPEIDVPFTLFDGEIATDSEGSLYAALPHANQVIKIDQNGIYSIFAGTGDDGFSGDGGLAVDAMLNKPQGIAVAPDGTIYIADTDNNRIRKVDAQGIITTVAGNGGTGNTGNGGPALLAELAKPRSIAISPDGSIYIIYAENPSSSNDERIRRIGTNGIIYPFDKGNNSSLADGASIASVRVLYPRDIAVGTDGVVYFISGQYNAVYQVGKDGLITRIAGGGFGQEDGIFAKNAFLNDPQQLAIGADNTLFVTEGNGHRIRSIGADGIIRTAAGKGEPWCQLANDLPNNVCVNTPSGIAVSPNGDVFYLANAFYGYNDANVSRGGIFKITRDIPRFQGEEIIIPASGSDQLYIFNQQGRHLRTVDSVTGVTLYTFRYETYGVQNYLVEIEDLNGEVTTIERNPSSGEPIAIVGPYGQRTELELTNGYLTKVTNPAQEPILLTYSTDGLLTSMTSPREYTWTYEYYDDGRLMLDSQPEEVGGFKALTRIESTNGYTATLTTAEGYLTTYVVTQTLAGERIWTNIFPGGVTNQVVYYEDGSQVTTYADDTTVTVEREPDPRFGMLSPIASSTEVTTPSGLTYSTTIASTVTLENPGNLLAVETITDTVSVNGQTYTTVYDQEQNQVTYTTPEGRQAVAMLDEQGRVISEQVVGLEPIFYGYDARGRLETITLGEGENAREYTVIYNVAGYVEKIIEPLLDDGSLAPREVYFEYDEAGRIELQVLPGAREIAYGYDDEGNLTSITPPGRPSHTFTYNEIGLNTAYIAPPVEGGGTNQTTYDYNLDGQLTQLTRPDTLTVTVDYDLDAGWPITVTIPRGTYEYGYKPQTGQLETIVAPDDGTLSFSYDGFLPTSMSWAGTISGTVTATYNNNFLVETLTVNGEMPIAYSYDDDGLLLQAGELSLGRYDATGLLKTTTLGVVDDLYEYNDFGELTHYQANIDGDVLFDVVYEYDAIGRIEAKTEMVDGVSTRYEYKYHEAGWLHEVWENGELTATYTYDENGNRDSYTDAEDNTITAEYDDQDRLLHYGDLTFTYTANGEMLTKTDNSTDETTYYEYDVLGNLIAVTLPDGTEIEYIIDGLNRRIGKRVNGELVQGFLYQDGLNPAAELDGEGNIVARFVYGSRINVPDYIIKNGEVYRVVTDHLDSVRFVTNIDNGSIVQRLDYDIWGNVINNTNSGFQSFGFAGGLFEVVTQLTRFGIRDYAAQVGRWETKDPYLFHEDLTNSYIYSFNDPINWQDIDGWMPEKPAGTIGGVSFLKPETHPGSQPHVHFGPQNNIRHSKTSGAINIDGSLRHGIKLPNKKVIRLINRLFRWSLPVSAFLLVYTANEALAADMAHPCSDYLETKTLVGSTVGGFLGSALLGAAAGSVVPGPGTVIGFTVGLVGGIGGSLAGEWFAKRY